MQKLSSQKSVSVAAVLVIASVALSALVIIMCFSGCPGTPVGCGQIPDPQMAVRGYFDALSRGSYADCDAHLYDFSVADMAQQPQSQAGQKLRTLLTDSYGYELIGPCELSGMDALQAVRVSYLDLGSFGEAVKKQANSIAGELNYQGIDIFTEEAAVNIALQAIDAVQGSASAFCTSTDIIVQLRYDGDQWLLLHSSELENMIMGVGAEQ